MSLRCNSRRLGKTGIAAREMLSVIYRPVCESSFGYNNIRKIHVWGGGGAIRFDVVIILLYTWQNVTARARGGGPMMELVEL